MATLQDINVNVYAQPGARRLLTFVHLSQNENGRVLYFRILGAGPFPSGSTAVFAGTKPDGNLYSTTGTVNGNFIIVTEDIQMTAVAGVWDAKLDVINGDHNIMTAIIRVTVDADPSADAVESDSQLDGYIAQAKYYAENAKSSAYGSPLVAQTASAMTNTKKVYVYTGSEDGYSTGYWYYYNGTAWTAGGAYNGVAVTTDTTLSQSGMAADSKTVGDELTQLSADLTTTGIVGNTVKNVVISGSTGKWATYANSEFVLYPVKPDETITIKTSTTATYYTVLTSDSTTIGDTPSYATGFSGIVYIGSNTQGSVTIPSDGKYLLIYKKSGSTVVAPSAVMVGDYDLLLSVPSNIKKITDDINEISAITTEIEESLESNVLTYKTIEDVVISGSTHKWTSYANSEFVVYPANPNDEVTIITGLTATYYTVLTNDAVAVGTMPSYATGYSGSVTVGSSTVATVKIPADGKYIVVFHKSGGSIVSPTSVTNGAYNYTINLKDNLMNVSDQTIKNQQKQTHTFAKRHPMVTFIDDDGNVEFYQYLLPIMRTYGIPMVSAYMGDANPDMQSNTAMMTKEQCDEVVSAGGELIVHYNTDATTLTIEQAEAMMLKSKAVLEKYGFTSGSNILAYSNGTSNTDIRSMVSKHFDCAFSGAYPRVSSTDRTNHDCIVQYAIHREPCGGLYYDNTTECATLDYFKTLIDECVANNAWLVFTMHSWLMPPDKQQAPHTGIDQFGLLEDIIEYIQELQQGGSNIEIVTASKGLATFGNAWQAGDYLGHWNEQTLVDTSTIGDHSQPGCAINKLGQYDFPTGNNLNSESSL